MKILWLHEKLGEFGGAEANVLASAEALGRRGWSNHLVYREATGRGEEAWRRVFVNCLAAEDPVAVAREMGADAVWIHNWPESADFVRLVEAGIPSARMVHDHATYCMRHYKYNPLTRRNCTRPASAACLFPCMAFLQRGAGAWPVRYASLGAKMAEIRDNRRLDLVVVASDFMCGELLKNGFAADRIRVIAPLPAVAGGGASSAPVDPVPGRVLFVGQVIRGKGVDLLLRALQDVSRSWHLSVVGQGSALPQVRSLAEKLGLASRVIFHGHLSGEEITRQYLEAQIVAVPSAWQEPFGMVGIEAMRHARPVVAFAVGGIPAWLRDGENGVLVPAGDVAALGAALGDMLSQPEKCRRMGLRGAELVATEFSFGQYIDKLADMLEGLTLSNRTR